MIIQLFYTHTYQLVCLLVTSWKWVREVHFLKAFSSVAQLCLTLCNPMNCSMPGFSVHHYLPEFAQTHVHWVSDTIQPSHPLLPTSPLAPDFSQHQVFFSVSQLFASLGQIIGASASASVLPMNIQDWLPLGLTGLISLLTKGLSRVLSSTTFQKCQFFSVQPSLWSKSHIHNDCSKNNSFDCTDLCRQSDVFAF